MDWQFSAWIDESAPDFVIADENFTLFSCDYVAVV